MNVFHDPRTGFHDIKGLSTTEQNYPFITAYVIAGLIILAALYLLFKFLKKYLFPEKKLSPTERALQKLSQSLVDLKGQKLSPREHASASSLILRDYLGESFDFNATELTNKEVVNKLITSSKKASQDMRKKLCLDVKNILKSLEKNTFADELDFKIEEFESLHKETINIIKFAQQSIAEKNIQGGT